MDPTDCIHPNLRKGEHGWYCPACGAQGVSALAVGPAKAPTDALVAPWIEQSWLGLPRYGLMVWVVTLLVAILVQSCFHFLHFITSMLGVLCHEMGHATIALLTGHLALPQFDLVYGGGVTTVTGPIGWVEAIDVIAPIALAYQFRHSLAVVAVCALVWVASIVLMLSGWDEPVQIEMGHGGQLVASTLFLYRALSGRSLVMRAERWIYGFLGWSIGMDVVHLCWNLITDADARQAYYGGKGNLDGDFVRLAEQHMNCSLVGVAEMNLVFCCLVPLLALGCFAIMQHWRRRATRS
jgi:hypothetical protein